MTLTELNSLEGSLLTDALKQCCGTSAWIAKMEKEFPINDKELLLKKAQKLWYECTEQDWKEAFMHHPKIGDNNSLQQKFASTATWAEGEQAEVKKTTQDVLQALSQGNKLYEQRFGYIFIVCATGKTAEEMLALLQARLANKPEHEIKIAMQEQNKITKLRLQKLLEL